MTTYVDNGRTVTVTVDGVPIGALVRFVGARVTPGGDMVARVYVRRPGGAVVPLTVPA